MRALRSGGLLFRAAIAESRLGFWYHLHWFYTDQMTGWTQQYLMLWGQAIAAPADVNLPPAMNLEVTARAVWAGGR